MDVKMLLLKRLSSRHWKDMASKIRCMDIFLTPLNTHSIHTFLGIGKVLHKSPSNPNIKGFLLYTLPFFSITTRRTMRLLTLKQVKEITLLSTATIYRLMKQDKFPKQIKLSERTSKWSENEIIEFIIKKMNDRNR